MRQLQQEHQTELHELFKKKLEFEEEQQAHDGAVVASQPQSSAPQSASESQPFEPYAEHDVSPGKSKDNARLRIHLSPPPAHLPHSPFMAVAEHFDRQQSIYDAQASVGRTLFHSPLATSLLSSVKSRMDSSWLTKTDGADSSGVGKLAAHAREWCFPMHALRGGIAAAAQAAVSAALGEQPFDSIPAAPAMAKCFQAAGLFKSHRLAASRGLLEVALAAAADKCEQPTLHSVIASSEWHGGVAVTVCAYAQPCKFPAYALKLAAKLRCINFPRIEPFVGVIVNDEQHCAPVASISVSEGVTLTEYLFKERHVLSPRDMVDLAIDVASAVACVQPLRIPAKTALPSRVCAGSCTAAGSASATSAATPAASTAPSAAICPWRTPCTACSRRGQPAAPLTGCHLSRSPASRPASGRRPIAPGVNVAAVCPAAPLAACVDVRAAAPRRPMHMPPSSATWCRLKCARRGAQPEGDSSSAARAASWRSRRRATVLL